MKIIYYKTVNIAVCFDFKFEHEYRNIDIDKIQEIIEADMWKHNFNTAEVYDKFTGEPIMSIKRDS